MANSNTRLSPSAALDGSSSKLRQSCPHAVSFSPAQRCRPGQQSSVSLALAQQQLDDLQQERDFLAARVAAIKVQLDVQTAHAVSAEAKVNRTLAELESIKRAQSQRVTSSTQFKELKAAAATAKQGLKLLEASVQTNQQRLQEHRQQVTSLQSELQLALRREEQSALALASVHDSLGCNSAALAALQQQLQHSQAEASLLRAQVAAADEASAQLQEAAQAEVKALQEQLGKAHRAAQQQHTIATKALGVALAARFAAAQLAQHNQQLQQDLAHSEQQLDETAAAAASTSKQLLWDCQAAQAVWQAEQEAHASTQQALQASQAELAACTQQLDTAKHKLLCLQQHNRSTLSALPDTVQPQPHCNTQQPSQHEPQQAGVQLHAIKQQQQQQSSSRLGQPHRKGMRSQPAASTAALQQELAACQAQLQEQRSAAIEAQAATRAATFEIAKLEAQRKHLQQQHSTAAAEASAAANTISSLRAQVLQYHAQCQLLQQKPQDDDTCLMIEAGAGHQQQEKATGCGGGPYMRQVVDDLANVQDSHPSSQHSLNSSGVQNVQGEVLQYAALYAAGATAVEQVLQQITTQGMPRLHGADYGSNSIARTAPAETAQLSRDWGSGLCVSGSVDGSSANGVSSGSRTPVTCSSWYSCYSTLPAEGSQQSLQESLPAEGSQQSLQGSQAQLEGDDE
jgi:chromosome segregation ATPase